MNTSASSATDSAARTGDATASAQPCGADTQVDLPGGGNATLRLYGAKQRTAGGQPLVLHFHGGAFVSGCLESGSLVPRLLASAGAVVASLAYPLAPAHPFPAGIETGYAALEWLHRQRVKLAGRGARVFLAGEEAGGNIAAAVAVMARDRAHPPLAGQILLSPMLDPCTGTPSLRDATCDSAQCKWTEGWLAYLRSPRDAEHPYAVPGACSRLAELAPTLVMAGEGDPMRDEAHAYAERLRGAGVPVRWQLLARSAGWPQAQTMGDLSQCACGPAVQDAMVRFFAETVAVTAPA